VRLAFEGHADFPALEEHRARRRGSQAAREHLRVAAEELARFFAGELNGFESPVDWSAFPPPLADVLRAPGDIPYGRRRSYTDLGVPVTPEQLGRGYGANPIPVVVPCHRVMRGVETPAVFVGGAESRSWLLAHERRHAGR
jgi:methylated-DNA-[protein]-cysteine S-methyltransferase